jgi:uncharacterized protein YggE
VTAHARAGAGAVVALISLSLAPAALADTTAPNTLSVNGNGSVMVRPDQASLSVSITRFASTAAPALSATNRVTNAVVSAVKAVGVTSSGIQTEGVNTSCGRVKVGPKGHKRRIRRCTANESISITSTATIVGQVIDAATHAGANNISGPDFSFSDRSAGEIAAERAAITNARNQANAAAAQLGYTVTGVQSIAINPQAGVSASGSASSAAPTRTKTPTPTRIHPGAEEVDATVAVVFTIAPATPAP